MRKSKSVTIEVITSKIHFVRNQKIMLDEDLAKLYGVTTKQLTQQIRRNPFRFPEDFMFQLTAQEFQSLRSQFVTSKRGGRRYLPYAFTENGVAMLSSVLKSRTAVKVNIEIMRTFTRLREILLSHKDLALKLDKLSQTVNGHERNFQVVFRAIKELVTQPPEKPKPQIGFHNR